MLNFFFPKMVENLSKIVCDGRAITSLLFSCLLQSSIEAIKA